MKRALAAALGALQTLAFVHTAAWWLPLATAAVLVHLLRGATPGRAAVLGWLYGTGWLVAGVWWLFISMHRYGGLPAFLAAAAVLALAAALSIYIAVASAAYARWASGVAWKDALLFAALWLAAELARGVFFTGFPWLASGYAWVDAPLGRLAPWIGVYGLGTVLAWAAAMLATLPRRSWRSRVLVGGGLAVLLLGPALVPPPEHTRSAGTLGVTLLQTNVPQDEKFAAEKLPATLEWAAQALLQARGPLVVSPETMVPLLPEQLERVAPGYWPALQEHFGSGARAALIGQPLGDYERGYTNSVVGLSASAAPYRYDKHHLVPFGEFIPTGFRWFTRMMNIPLGDFDRGVVAAPSFSALGQRIAPNICYEDLFGEELARRFVDDATAPTVLANMSNIGWFGDTIAVSQHLNLSRMRALELQRPMLRATNTGATAVIDHRGQVLAMLAPYTRGSLDAQVEGRAGLTPYARWAGHVGLWPLWVLAVGIVLAHRTAARRTR
ncbi:MAG: apolipoprotein N-acyltransferase [Rubrivivax sp.]|nr:apolipoprotein N-acyltransferase [Rubrivivax sp.]